MTEVIEYVLEAGYWCPRAEVEFKCAPDGKWSASSSVFAHEGGYSWGAELNTLESGEFESAELAVRAELELMRKTHIARTSKTASLMIDRLEKLVDEKWPACKQMDLFA